MNSFQLEEKKLNSEKNYITSKDIYSIINNYHSDVMSGFYEMQSNFMKNRYRKHDGLEMSTIIICLVKSYHLAIMRLRERDLNHDISINNFFENYLTINKTDPVSHKIVSIVKETGIPKETVRRKIKKLIKNSIVTINTKKEYSWNLEKKRENEYLEILQNDIRSISKFILTITKSLNIKLDSKSVEKTIQNNFSFFTYHFYNCQLNWLKWWQTKFGDIDMMFVIIQILIPTLKEYNADQISQKININNLHTYIGKTNIKPNQTISSVSATSISDITGIPRATSIRKLEKLVNLGVLVKENKTKRFYINQSTPGRTKNVFTRDTVNFTLSTFSDFFAVIINAIRNY